MCPDCFGKKSHAGMAIDECHWCHTLQEPCKEHQCKRCQGSGMVCPACRGDRIVQEFAWSTAFPTVKTCRCEICCVGNQVNPAKELAAIERWIKKHGPQQPELKVVQ